MRGPSSGPNPGFGPGSGPPRFGFSHNSGKPGNVPGPGLNEVRPTMGPTGPAQNTAGPWKRYFSPEGKPYYYNTVTGETTWTDPLAPPSAVPTTGMLHCIKL
ncbi:hypothetical protein SARC_18161 [Sphaeroforma arctica JP610]|uniref:WW domain-containing protein n=1 Tax=Sphaeroforma arctica JP610 TaxID=667725 RepID=A0A0L0EY53_9EUKA|nr:hypothetical protein SARC_18161 [Sphaeroforma arctica JP610]KNC69329.1 hypothetical protein SARC_18161 [Sphaeroforma arctica JP610]|eukprot:XP_014143231.1 hypothetical protein SARC_18161 [Sphaeroforma arctica JP610]